MTSKKDEVIGEINEMQESSDLEAVYKFVLWIISKDENVNKEELR